MKNKLIMLVGVASSGKSTIGRGLLENGEVDKIVSSDAVRAELYGDENDQTHNNEVFNEVHNRIRKFLKEGYSVCYDATNLSCKRRMNFLKQLRDLDIEKECIVVMTSFEDCIMRQSSRDRKVPEGVIRRQIKSFQCPYYYEGWDTIQVIHTSHIPLKWFEQQNRISHDNPHHSTGTILEHMDEAYSIYNQCESNMDKTAALGLAIKYHDLGKYFCKQFTLANGKPSDIAHYYKHQNAGAYFYLLDNNAFRMYSNSLEVAVLIQWHMEFFTREEKGLERLFDMLGERLSKELETLHKYDLLAH